MDYLSENLHHINERIAAAACRVNRKLEDITLVAVSKTVPPESIRKAHQLGVMNFGENYIQESVEKIASLAIPARWHFIGHLQKNKVRIAIRHFDMIQTVHSRELLERIDRIAGEEKKVQDLLIQVNIAEEKQKSGIEAAGVISIIDAAQSCQNVRIKGLMLIPPFYEDPEKNRRNFALLRELSVTIDSMNLPNWENRCLSMGMTDDFEIAIEEGSNMVRIGRAVFGPRGRK